MKLIHTGDLHIGKTVNNFNMLPDQRAVLHEMVELARIHQAQAFIIAGDVYDRAVPTAEAVTVMNDFMNELKMLDIPVFIISGNHDSPQRLAFANEILDKQQIYIAGTFEGKLPQITLQDEYGDLVITMMPFVKPALLSVKDNEEAVKTMLQTIMESLRNQNCRNVLVTHYFVTNAGKEPELSDSETGTSVGGLDNVDGGLFGDFDYVALGHIHKQQRMDKSGSAQTIINYAGAPIAYSFSECEKEKTVTLVEIRKKGDVEISHLPLHPLHHMRKIKGRLNDLMMPEVTLLEDTGDYIQATLTNEEELIDPVNTLRSVYPNLMQLLFEKNERNKIPENLSVTALQHRTMTELFSDFYSEVREKEMDDNRRQLVEKVIKELEE